MRARYAIACALAALLAGCSSGSGGDSAQPTDGTPSTGTPTGLTPKCPPGPLGGGHFSFGRRVHITDEGFDPQLLVTGMGLKIVWTNDSSTTQSVHFDNWGTTVDSGPIAPGTSWTFEASHTGSALYHSTYEPTFCGQLQVQLTGNGSEPGG